MIGAVAAIVVPLAGATGITLQVESGGVHMIAAAGVHTITIRTAKNANAPHAEISRDGRTVVVSLSGHSGVDLPFVSTNAGAPGYEIVYPANASIALEDSSGSIAVEGARGALDLEADDGGITVTLAREWHGSSLRMQSANGDLRLAVPPAFRARVDASTGKGHLYNTLPRKNENAKRPFVWLFTQSGDVYLTTSP